MWVAIVMTVLAGAATALGGLIGVWGPHTSHRMLSAGVALSAGVMIGVSLIELLPGALAGSSPWLALSAFGTGAGLVLLVERVAGRWSPADRERQRQAVAEHGMPSAPEQPSPAKLTRLGLTMALVLAAHNAPEGFVTLITALQDPVLALPVAVAIAIHNIPEGIAVAIPIYHASGHRLKAWAYASASGLAEPVGALLLYAAVGPFLNEGVHATINAGIAGIMVFISFHELLPLALETEKKTTVSLWAFLGIIVMAASLIALA
ncbi:zinc transporter ZupT [Tessaracoccus sp. OH4464_COT-324]|nr:zinc transporter ZupT [Tessaracoccus sp. OH4464_COT-324]